MLKSKPADFGRWTTANEPMMLFKSALSFVRVACVLGGVYLVGSRVLGAQHMYVAHIAQTKQLDPGGYISGKNFSFYVKRVFPPQNNLTKFSKSDLIV